MHRANPWSRITSNVLTRNAGIPTIVSRTPGVHTPRRGCRRGGVLWLDRRSEGVHRKPADAFVSGEGSTLDPAPAFAGRGSNALVGSCVFFPEPKIRSQLPVGRLLKTARAKARNSQAGNGAGCYWK